MKLKRGYMSVAALLLMALLLFSACSKNSDGNSADPSDNAGGEQQSEETEAGMTFPYELEGGKLAVQSIFQSSIENPDCGNELAEDIASLELTNQSDEFCITAEVTVTMQDGMKLSFTATNIPSGKTIWAFASDNTSISLDNIRNEIDEIEVSAQFGEASLMEDQVSVAVDNTTITIQNLTEEEITNLTVGCHCLFDEVYFGGLTYNYPVESIAAGESVTIEADDCYMGTAEVVSITRDN